MTDLIAQIEHAAAGSLSDEVRLLKERRQSLDDVIKFTLGINDLQKSLESVILLKKPAKDIPRDLLKILGDISASVANLPTTELDKRLHLLEQTIRNDINTIMGISNQLELLNASVDLDTSSQVKTSKLHKLVTDFRRRSNTAIILKLHLRQRGAKVPDSVIPVSTDELVHQVSKLVEEEKRCRERTVQRLRELDEDVGNLIINPKHPIEIKTFALMLHDQINQNIGHLVDGKDIEKMPFAIEIISVGSEEQPEKSEPKTAESDVSAKEQIIEKPLEPQQKTTSGFFTKLFKWLSSPWSVKWRDL